MTFAQKMKELRTSKGLSQRGLAALLVSVRGVGLTPIARLESGTWIPDAGQMAHILDALKASPEERADVEMLARATAVRSAEVA